ncbi:hypothetical protein [Rosistilla carotiformis]|nr:hypothetical protein [Rosistilla carotiformis]
MSFVEEPTMPPATGLWTAVITDDVSRVSQRNARLILAKND